MCGLTRLYLDVRESIPLEQRPPLRVRIIDCAPEDAAALKRRLQRRGYSVLAVAL